MLAILNDVAALGTVTQQEFTDLKTLVSYFNKTNGIQVSSYVAYISNALVNGDAANATWTGGATSSVALGNLAAGSSQTNLNELIGKWFLGTDLPAPIFGDTAASPASSLITGVYFNDTNPLYNSTGAPAAADINQGALGDCYFLASLAEAAQDDPGVIESMITTDGNGSYGVRFYISGQPVYVTVNTELPLYPNSTYYIGNSSTDLWASLAEKAFVELNAEPGATIDHPTGNEYLLIGGGHADPITQITGKQITYYDTGNYTATTWASLKSTIATAIQSGEEVDYASSGATNVISGKSTFIQAHMFSGIGYDSTTGDFILRNPWGVSQTSSQSWLTEFEVSISDLFTNDAGGGGGYLAVAQGTVTAGFGAALPATATQLIMTGMAANQSTTDTSNLSPFSNVVINDQAAGATDTVTVTLSAPANGALSNLGGGVYNPSTGVYTDAGSATAVTAALDGLVFIPTAHQAPAGQTVTTGFTIGVADTVGQSVTDSTTTVVTSESTVPPNVTAVTAAYQAILRTTPVAATVNQVAAQITAGQTTLTSVVSSLIAGTQAQETTVPALIVYDVFYGGTEGSGGLDYVTNLDAVPVANLFIASNNPNVEEAVYSTLGSWFSVGANNFATLYPATMSRTSYIDDIYQNIFGTQPASGALTYLLGSVNNYVNAVTTAGIPNAELLGRGAVYGDLLFDAESGQAGKYYAPANQFLTAAANGSVSYGPELTTEFPATSFVVATNSDAQAAAADDPNVVTVIGSNQTIDPGMGSHSIQFLSGATNDAIVLHTGGVDQVSGFDGSTDIMDFSALLSEANVNLNGDLTALGKYVTIADQGANALVNFDPTGHGGGSTVAVLQGLGSVVPNLNTLLAQGATRIG